MYRTTRYSSARDILHERGMIRVILPVLPPRLLEKNVPKIVLLGRCLWVPNTFSVNRNCNTSNSILVLNMQGQQHSFCVKAKVPSDVSSANCTFGRGVSVGLPLKQLQTQAHGKPIPRRHRIPAPTRDQALAYFDGMQLCAREINYMYDTYWNTY